MSPDVQGRRREFTVIQAAQIGIMTELTHFGFGSPLAGVAAMLAIRGFRDGYRYAFITDPKQIGAYEDPQKLELNIDRFKLDVREVLDDPKKIGHRPLLYLIIDVGSMMDKMQKAEEEWQSHLKARAGQSEATEEN